MSGTSKINVLFCCLGNICRSTMAEGVFQSLARQNARMGTIDSCGTGAYHDGDSPDERTMETLKKYGITDYDHAARQITSQDFQDFDYIFAMDRHNLRDLQRMQKRLETKNGVDTRAKVMLFGEFSGGKVNEEVQDPYYGADNGFEEAYSQVSRFSANFLKNVVDKGGS